MWLWEGSFYAQKFVCGIGAYISIHGDAIGELLKLEHQLVQLFPSTPQKLRPKRWAFFPVASGVPLFSRFPEAEAVEFCHKNADCKRGLCAGSLVFCVNGVCACEVSRDESAAAPEPEPERNAPPVLDKCSNVGDCKNMNCPPVIPIHRDCVNGECKCVR